MPDSPVRVALLARPGEVRDHLRRALADFGAQLVAEGDPAELDPRTVADGRPGVVVVSLEPAIEDALDRFESLLGSPDVEVIYDDAEVTRLLDGWDLARWARHLAAKLAGGEAVLPPAPAGAEQELPEFEISLEPGAPPTPAQQMDAEKLEDYAAESLDLSEWVPTTPSLTDIVVEAEETAVDPGGDDAALGLELDLAGLEEAMTPKGEDLSAPPATAAPDLSDDGFIDASALALAETPTDFLAAGTAAEWTVDAEPAAAAPSTGQDLDDDATLELDDVDTTSGFAADANTDFDGDASLDLKDEDEPAMAVADDANLAAFGLSAAEAPLEFADAEAPLELADADASFEPADIDLPPASGNDAPLDFADSEAPLELADAEAPLDFADSETPLELADTDAPLEFAEFAPTSGNDAPLDFADAAAPLEFATAETPLDFADEAAEASLDLADQGDPFDFASAEASVEDASADAPPDFAEIDEPLELADITADADDDNALDMGSLDALDLDLDLDVDLSALDAAPAAAPEPERDAEPAEEAPLADLEMSDSPVKFSNFTDEDPGHDGGMDDDVAALAAQLDAFEANDQRGVAREPDFANLPQTPAAAVADDRRPPPPPAAKPEATGPSAFASLELVPMDADLGKVTAADGDTPPSPSLAAVPVRRSSLSLAAEDAVENNETVDGALFVVAGLGGPDGVRQLLSALPPTLPVPVLLYQHLDTGKHERLVGQLAKASRLPLDLAAEGKLAFSGRVSVLQPGIGIRRREQNIEFIRVEGLAAVVAAMAAKDSIVLVLSGADPSVVPAVLALGAAGGMMLAQDPASCFDPVAPQAVIAAGATTAPLNELAQKIVERWT